MSLKTKSIELLYKGFFRHFTLFFLIEIFKVLRSIVVNYIS